MSKPDFFGRELPPSIMDIPEPGVIKLDTRDWTDQEKSILNTLLELVNDRRSGES